LANGKNDRSFFQYKVYHAPFIQPQTPDFSTFIVNRKLLAAGWARTLFERIDRDNHLASDITRQSFQVCLSIGAEDSMRLTF
jgi:hypothetical protein